MANYNNTTLTNGDYYVLAGESANDTTVNDYGHLLVSSGGTANRTTVNYRGQLYLLSGGMANSATVNSGGNLYVSSGGTANSTTVNASGYLYVSSGGTATGVVENGGYVAVADNANATFTSNIFSGLVLSKASATVHSGTTANNTTLNLGGNLYVSSGGTANSTTVNSRGYLYLFSGGTANSTTVNSGGILTVSNGGVVNSTTVNDGSILSVSSGGTALHVEWIPFHGEVNIAKGAYVTFVDMPGVYYGSGGQLLSHAQALESQAVTNREPMYVMSDGIANNATVSDDGLLTIWNGGTANSTTVSRGSMFVYSGGIANNTTVNSGSMFVYSGGMANSTTLNYSWGGMFVSSGGMTNNTTVNSSGYLYVYSGGTANSTTVNWGSMFVSSGGVANNTTVNFNGRLYVSGGGTANNTTVNGGGNLYVSSGGMATGIVENGGYVVVADDANVTFASNIFSGLVLSRASATIHSGTTANNTTLQGYYDSWGDTYAATLIISRGGTANSTTINRYGNLTVNSGGMANSTTVNSSGCLYVSRGGTANGIVENGGCVVVDDDANVTFASNTFSGPVLTFASATVHSGTTANSTTVSSRGYLYVYSGGTVNDTMVEGNWIREHGYMSPPTFYYGYLTVYDGGTANNTTVNDCAYFYVSNGGTANSTAVNEGGNLFVSSGGTANCTAVNFNGYQYVSSGGTANSTTVNFNGWLDVSSGGTANSTTVNDGGIMFVSSGGTANRIVENGGQVEVADDACVTFASNTFSGLNLSDVSATVHSGTTANNTTVNDYGNLTVFSGGTANNTTVNEGGAFNVSRGGLANSTTVNKGGNLLVSSGGTANSATVNERGSMSVSSGGTANNTTVNDYGNLTVFSGGTANSTMVNEKGKLHVPSGGTANGITLLPDGGLVVSSGGKLTGHLTINGYWMDVSISSGAVIDFDLTQTSVGVEALVNDISRILDAPVYTLTVSGMHRSGTYNLAEGAAGFNKTIKVQDTTGRNLGTLTVGQTLACEHNEYMLLLNESTLSLIVTGDIQDSVPPTVSGISADITAPTNRNVTVSAFFEDDVELEQSLYRIGENGEWSAYVNGATVSENTIVYFKAVDTSGNESEIVSHMVNNIDKVAPTIANIMPNTTEPATSVTVTANFSDDVALASQKYKIGDGAWQDYTGGVTVTENDTVYFRAIDTAGNESGIISYEVSNIHAVDPKNEPDDGTNDYLWTKKDGWNDANIHVSNTILGNVEIDLDVAGTVGKDGKHNLFGNDGANKDAGDVAKIGVYTPAKLTFTIDSTAAGTFYVYEDGFDKKGNRKQITVGKVTVKAGQVATLKDVCLTATGNYYVAMTAKNVKKAGTEGLYNVSVTENKFFVDADSGDNNEAKDSFLASIGRGAESVPIHLDSDPMTGSTKFKNFVGFSDGADYVKMDLTSSAYLSFSLTGEGDGKAKFTVWKRVKGTTGKLSKAGGATTLNAKNGYKATTKAQFLDASKYDYYFSMECTDAAKGKGVYYNVAVTDDTVFFDSADNGRNDVLYDKKAKAFYAEDETHHFETTSIGGGTKAVKLDSDSVEDAGYENFVGYQDASDYAKIELTTSGDLYFKLKASGNATFTVYEKGQDKKGNDTLKAIQTTKLTLAKGKTSVEATTDLIADLAAGEYYVSMTAKSTKANAFGSVFYNVTANLNPSVADALSMPDTASVADALSMPETDTGADALSMPETDNLGISDALSFGGYDADVLVDASASALADLDDKTGWMNIASLA